MKTNTQSQIAITLAVSVLSCLIGPGMALAAGPAAINLGTASNFVILAKTGISTTGSTSVVGDIGVSPAAATYITGFALTLPSASAYSTSALISGKAYAPGYADPTPAVMSAAISDMATAYTDGSGRTNPTATELGAGNIGGLTLAPGLYRWGTGVTIPTNVTLSGSANDVWIFQIAQNLDVSSGVHIVLAGGAQASNVFWVVAGQTTIGTTAAFNGNVLDQTAIVLHTGASLSGRALAQTAVTLDANAVSVPSSVAVSVTPTPTPTPTVVVPANTPAPATTGSSTTVTPVSYATPAITTTTTTSAPMTTPSANQPIRMVSSNLSKGTTSANVRTLQQFLISQNKGHAAAALTNVGATAYFGVLTRAALAEFQAQAGISPALGNFGPITRAYVSAHY